MTEPATSPVFIRLGVEVLEDLHTGSGTGSGDIDALVERDRRGWPVVRDTHFKGLLREAGDELVALGRATCNELNSLLGTPATGRGALSMTSLRLCDGGDTLVWASSERARDSRVPLEDTLRFVQHVAAGTHFEATLRLSDERYRPLVEKLLQRIDRLGGDRNRGAGLVKLSKKEPEPEATRRSVGQEAQRLRLILRNLEPLCLPASGHPGNLLRSHSFVRGQTLRGALLGWAMRNHQAPDLTLFDRIWFGDALPLPPGYSQLTTVMPIPLSILTEKPGGSSRAVPWWAQAANPPPAFDRLGETRTPDEKPKRPDAHEYLGATGSGDGWLRYAPTMRVRLRNATPPKDSQQDAELFSVEEIAEDTRFQADLVFQDRATAKRFLELLEPVLGGGDWLAIGRGGRPARIESVTPVSQARQRARVQHDQWTLTLTSDLILRGPELGFLGNLDIRLLCELAGIENGHPDWRVEKQSVETQAVHGFNAASGLSRAPALSIRRGSCWEISGAGSAALAAALREKQALGERTREGFGRFLIDVQPIFELAAPGGQKPAPEENRSETLRRLARGLAGEIKGTGPSLSQLQWLRSNALAASKEELECLLDKIADAPTRRPQGGGAWKAFPVSRLKHELEKLSALHERRQLVSDLVKEYALNKAREGQ